MLVNNSVAPRPTSTGNRPVAAAQAPGQAGFIKELLEAEGQQAGRVSGELDALQAQLDLAGQSLEKNPTLPNFRRYRCALRDFMKAATREAYRLEERTSLYSGKIHEVVAVVNREADQLYSMVMQGESGRIGIAAKLDQIRGLVVSLRV